MEDVNKNYRYAALNLASLHARLGHNEEALAAVKVALRVMNTLIRIQKY